MKKKKIDNELDIYGWNYGDISILDLKKWADKQIKDGKKTIRLKLVWGYYHEMKEITLISED